MSDGSAKVPAQATPPVSTTASYARIYEEQQPRLVAFARSLTRNNSWAAEDLVAEAHFRVWRRLSAGHEIENVPAYLMTTVRHLAATAGGDTRETPHDPQAAERADLAAHTEGMADPAEQVSSVDLLVRVLGQLPERWVQALWLAEAEGQPLETVGQRIGAKQGATAVLLHRAREGMRQAFLRNQTGAPDDPACEVHWVRMPAYVRGNATPRQSERLLAHVDACDDCRGRLAVLMRANDRLPAFVGPALLVFAVGGAGKFLLPLATGSAGATVALSGQLGGVLHGVRQAVTGGGAGGAKVPAAVAAGATVTGMALAMVLALGTGGGSAPTPASPRVPLAEAPVAQPSAGAGAGERVPGDAGDSEGSAGAPEVKHAEQRRTDGGAEVLTAGDDGSGTAARPVVEAEPGPVAEAEPQDEEPPAADEPVPAPAEPVTETPDVPAPAEPVGEQPEMPVAPVAPGTPGTPGQEVPYPENPGGSGDQGDPADPGTGVEHPEPEAPEAPEVPEPPEVEAPEIPSPPPSPSPSPEPVMPTPAEPGPVEEPPDTPPGPDTPETPESPQTPEAPQPTPEDPGNHCGN